MHISNMLSDDTVLAEIGSRIAARRLALQLTQAQVASQAGVAKRTLERVEAGQSAQLATIVRILRALESLQDLERILPEAGPTPMELLRNRGKKRQRAPGKDMTREDATTWTWDDKP